MFYLMTSLIVAIPPKPIPVTDKFLVALAMVESNGNSKAVGDGGRAVGAFQLHPIFIKESNRIMKAPVFNLDDRYSYLASKEATKIVLRFWAKWHRDNRGVKITPEMLCSLHRHPGEDWTERWLKTPLEWGRSKRLRLYMSN